jgi:predicted nucleic acid-binding protein
LVTFWEASAIVPLVVREETSRSCRDLRRRQTDEFTIWWGTAIEVTSAIQRKRREGRITDGAAATAGVHLEALVRESTEVPPDEAVRAEARRLLGIYGLRAADALQLAAALVAVHGRPMGKKFIAADGPLLRSAALEGFDAVAPDAER